MLRQSYSNDGEDVSDGEDVTDVSDGEDVSDAMDVSDGEDVTDVSDGEDVSDNESSDRSSSSGRDISALESGDSDIEASSPPPPLDITMAPSHEIMRIYGDLIDSCRGFEEESLNETSDVLKDNIKAGGLLFRQMEVSLSQSFDQDQTTDNRRTLAGNSASELFMACQHTKMCTLMLKQATKNVGCITNNFKMDDFLNSLVVQMASVDLQGGYSVLLAVRKLAFTSASVSYTAPDFQTLIGCSDDSFLTVVPKDEKKDIKVKQRAPRRKDESQIGDATQKEVVNNKTEAKDEKDSENEDETPEGLSKDIVKSVKNKYKENNAPSNMLEVVCANSVPDLLSRMFAVAFVVRDGHIGISRDAHGSNADTTTTLMLKPEKPPEKNQSMTKNSRHRNQYIASFSAKFLKELARSN